MEFLSRWETYAKMRQVSLKFPHQDSNQLAMDNKFMKLGYSTSLETCINKRTVTNKLWTTHEKSPCVAPDYTCRTMDEYSSCLTLELVESRTPTNSSTEAFESLKSDWCLRSIAAKGEPNHFWSTFNDCIVWKYKHSIIEILWSWLLTDYKTFQNQKLVGRDFWDLFPFIRWATYVKTITCTLIRLNFFRSVKTEHTLIFPSLATISGV